MNERMPVIVAARRTPFGRRDGGLSRFHPTALLAAVHDAVLHDSGLEPGDVDVVMTGAVTQIGEQAYNVGRVSVLSGGWPVDVPAVSINAQCGSSQQAVNLAASAIAAGDADIVVASGVESMSRVPLGSDRAADFGDVLDAAFRARYEATSAGEAAERIAERWGISREECDAYSWRSHARAAAASDATRAQLVPVTYEGVTYADDECIRETGLEKLSSLKPAFRPDGYHTAASSSPITDGAAAVLLMSRERSTALGLEPLAAVTSQAFVGVDPVMKLTGPIPVTARLLARSGLTLADFDSFEINEAFASVVLAWQREYDVDASRVNPDGGAIALGHPVGATGARLIGTAAHRLRRTGGGRALIAMCVGGGMGTGSILEAVPR
ncbi:thiolase family protein [Spirillospora sp. CA-255316]